MYEDLKEILCHELNEITRKGDIDREGLDDVYKLSSAITMVESLMKKQGQGQSEEYSNEYSNEGASNEYSRRRSMRNSYDGMSNTDGNSHDYGVSRDYANRGEQYSRDYSRDGSYDYSERRGRDPQTGRYVSRDNSYAESYDRGYSRHTAEQKVARKLEDMLDTTQDQHIRNAITKAMEMLKQ
jgi:hypothetical protein